MKNSLLVFIFLNLICQLISGQTNCPKKFIESKYKIENSLKMDCDLSQEFTLIGMYHEALLEEDKFLARGGGSAISNPTSFLSTDSNLRITKASTYIYDLLKKNEVVLLNERHNVPQHRVFFYTLLDSLQHYGFSSVFMETLAFTPDDSLHVLHNRIEDWGYYTDESIFHQVSHKLERMHYQLYSYEIEYPRKIDTARKNNTLYFTNKSLINWIPIETDSLLLKNFFSENEAIQRETEQALNIYQKIIRNKIKKAFIYCGYTHLFKGSQYMGGMLQHLLGKKICSIDQMYLHEHTDIKYENSLYTRYATVSYPFVITDDHNRAIHTIRHIRENHMIDTLFDVSVASPRSIYINNRPTWLELNGDRKRYKLRDLLDVRGMRDYLLIIYDIAHDSAKAGCINARLTPVDVFQVTGNGEAFDALLTPNRKYKLVAVKNGTVRFEKIIDTDE